MAMHPEDKSELTFGAYDRSKFIGDIEWHPVVDQLFWSLKLDDIEYNGVPLNICEDQPNGCMITPDSGTSLITTPTWAYEKLQKILPQENNCTDKYIFGSLTFVINGKKYDIPSHHFMDNYKNVYEKGDQMCMTSITNLDIL